MTHEQTRSPAEAHGDERFSIQEIAEAAQYAEVSDGNFRSMLISLGDTHRARKSQAQPKGLSEAQEPKYTVNGSAIVNRFTGEAIPPDEPVFVFRARDALGVPALQAYLALIGNREPASSHADAVAGRIADFERFAAEHPERMKWPDTDRTAAQAPAPAHPACKGMNCGATDGKSHSAECFAEHAATVDPGIGERHREARYAGYKGEPFPRSASEDERAAWMVGFKARLPAVQAPAPAPEPVAVRYDFDGYGWKYIDNGSGSDWMTRHPDGELLFDGASPAVVDEKAWLLETSGGSHALYWDGGLWIGENPRISGVMQFGLTTTKDASKAVRFVSQELAEAALKSFRADYRVAIGGAGVWKAAEHMWPASKPPVQTTGDGNG